MTEGVKAAEKPRPSEIWLKEPIPLVDTFGRSELEIAAALIVRACQKRGDVWQPVWLDDVLKTMSEDETSGTEPLASLIRNPFLRPDFAGLLTAGIAVASEPSVAMTSFTDSIALTDEAILRIALRHRKLLISSGDLTKILEQRDEARKEAAELRSKLDELLSDMDASPSAIERKA